MARVLLLNSNGALHGIIDLRRAFSLIERQAAVVVAEAAEPVRLVAGVVPCPSVLYLRRYAPVARPSPRALRKEILLRDNYTCAYCGQPAHTVDHVRPRHLCRREQREANVWENMVAACWDCQQRKGGQTLREAGMAFRAGFTPQVGRASLIHALRTAPPEWANYLPTGHAQTPD